MFANLTTVTQGSIGLAAAIYHFQKSGYNVCLPLVDNQSYDLIAEKDGIFYTVQCKTTRFKTKSGKYAVQLRRVRSNKTVNKVYSLSKCDFVFILCSDDTQYCVPFDELTSVEVICLNSYYDKFKVNGR